MKLVIKLLLATTVAVIAACSNLPFFGQGCGCSAYYEIPRDGEIRIQFREVHSETVNGQTDCGFKDVPIRVTVAKVRGVELKEFNQPDPRYANNYVYAAPPDFDPKKDVVTIEAKGSTYISKPDSVKQIGDSIWFDLK